MILTREFYTKLSGVSNSLRHFQTCNFSDYPPLYSSSGSSQGMGFSQMRASSCQGCRKQESKRTVEGGPRQAMKGNPKRPERQGQKSQGSWGSQSFKETLCRKIKLIAQLMHWNTVRGNLHQQGVGMAIETSLGIN